MRSSRRTLTIGLTVVRDVTLQTLQSIAFDAAVKFPERLGTRLARADLSNGTT